jgi:hypothetical protein
MSLANLADVTSAISQAPRRIFDLCPCLVCMVLISLAGYYLVLIILVIRPTTSMATASLFVCNFVRKSAPVDFFIVQRVARINVLCCHGPHIAKATTTTNNRHPITHHNDIIRLDPRTCGASVSHIKSLARPIHCHCFFCQYFYLRLTARDKD